MRDDNVWLWFYDVYYCDNNWMKEFIILDEYMFVRWFKLFSCFFFIVGVVCCLIFMSLYVVDIVLSVDVGLKIFIIFEKSGIVKYILFNVRIEFFFAVVMVFIWIISFFLIFLICVELCKYVYMMWMVDFDKIGIKVNVIFVKDMFLLITVSVSKKFE